jgi:hypothetical protein
MPDDSTGLVCNCRSNKKIVGKNKQKKLVRTAHPD